MFSAESHSPEPCCCEADMCAALLWPTVTGRDNRKGISIASWIRNGGSCSVTQAVAPRCRSNAAGQHGRGDPLDEALWGTALRTGEVLAAKPGPNLPTPSRLLLSCLETDGLGAGLEAHTIESA